MIYMWTKAGKVTDSSAHYLTSEGGDMRSRFGRGFLILVMLLLLCSFVSCTNVPNGFRATLIDKEGNTFDVFDLTYAYILGSYLGNFHYGISYIPAEYKEATIAVPFKSISDLSLNYSGYSSFAFPAQINLTDGSSLSTRVPWLGHSLSECGFKGKTKFSDYFLELSNTQSVVFHHELDNHTGNTLNRPQGSEGSVYTAKIETWSGNKFTFSDANQFGWYLNDEWFDVRPVLNFKQGTVDGKINFEDIRTVKVLNESEGSALIATTSGETLNVSLPFMYGPPQQRLTYCIGGKLEDLGYARIPLSEIKELELES